MSRKEFRKQSLALGVAELRALVRGAEDGLHGNLDTGIDQCLGQSPEIEPDKD